MATYKEIKGVTVQTLDEDPVVGGIAGATWSSGGALNTGRGLMGNGMGTQTAAAVVAGFSPPNSYYDRTEEYDGSSWTESGDLAVSIYLGMAGGTQTAGIYAGGYGGSWPANAETYYYNGTSWSDQSADINTARDSLRGTGIQTAALACGGISGPGSPADDETETWNGSAWSEVSELNTGRYSHNVAGTSTDAIAGPGTAPPGYAAAVETWNGSSWTETTEINTSRNNYGRTNYAAGGASTGALIFGGQSQPSGSPATLTANEFWNGSSWTELADLGTGRSRLAGAGTTTAALAVGAYPSTNNTATEEFSAAPVTAAILTEGDLFLSGGTTLKGFGRNAGIPAATWASSGGLNTARAEFASFGTQTAALAVGGWPAVAINESYNGSTWTELADLNEGRGLFNGSGTTTAGLVATGYDGSHQSSTETWNGSAWTEVGDVNTARLRAGSSKMGPSSATLIFGGEAPPGDQDATESWNGTSWTEVNNLNDARIGMGGAGTQTAAISAGGAPGPGSPSFQAINEIWDGTSWTEVADLNTARVSQGATGPQSATLIFGGTTPPNSSTGNTESWNGSSWTEVNNLGGARKELGGAGASSVSALAFGGADPSATGQTEEFTADNTLSTVTVS